MRRDIIEVDSTNVGRRLETIITSALPHIGRGRLMKWLRVGKIRLNGRKAKPMTRMTSGDVVEVPFGASTPPVTDGRPCGSPRPMLPPLQIAHEDEDLLIVDKPAGLASHPGMLHQHDSLSARVVAHLAAWDAPVGLRPGLAQRLDAEVSGLVPCGKHASALRSMMGPPHGPPIFKLYVAWVAGELRLSEGVMDWPLRSTDEPRGDRPKTLVDFEHGRPARTKYQVLARRSGRTLVRLKLETGRTHQIRAHLRALGHPILGDSRYGTYEVNRHAFETYGTRRVLLHAARIAVVQPMTGQRVVAASALPTDMCCLL